MRNLLFKNVTSEDKMQRVLASSEFIEQKGVRSSIHRHLVCRIISVSGAGGVLPRPTLFVVRRQDTRFRLEHFYCRIKGRMYLAANESMYLVSFIHSLRIELTATQKIHNS